MRVITPSFRTMILAVAILSSALSGCGEDGVSPPPPVEVPLAPVDSVIQIDEAHHNFHTRSGRYAPFAELLEDDGYVVQSGTSKFSASQLANVDVLVIANALHSRNADGDWSLPTPSAFTAAEVATVRTWVEGGGALLLIADHMPFPGAAEELAGAFGVRFQNGFAYDTLQIAEPTTCLRPDQIHVFRRSDGTLGEHAITNGRTEKERVDSVATFTGQAFELDPELGAEPLLLFGPSAVIAFPEIAWIFDAQTARESAEGAAQGAVLSVGSGRVAIFGEAAMFSEQTCGADNLPMGINAPAASDNSRLLLNVIQWLMT